VRKLLVTGAGGFIGRAIVKAARDYGWEPHAVGRYICCDPPTIPGAATVSKCDVRDELGMVDVFNHVQPDAVSHHAGMSGLAECEANPTQAFSNNVLGTSIVFELAKQHGASFLLASTRTVLGDCSRAFDDNGYYPNSVYATSKLMAEQLLRRMPDISNTRIVLRYPNVYGPGQSRGLFTTAARQMLQGETPVMRGAHTRREYVHVDDIVRAHFLALESHHGSHQMFDVGGGQPANFVDLIEAYKMLARSVGRYMPAVPEPSLAWPAQYDTGHMITTAWELGRRGWKPQIELQAGIDQTVDWVAEQLEITPYAPVTGRENCENDIRDM